jgi:peptide/nickel transport system ATP-binding protein/oligopeptide transport system ATP-binding protein
MMLETSNAADHVRMIEDTNKVNLIEAIDLKKYFPMKSGGRKSHREFVRAVDGVDLSIARGSVVGIVGESGCGKSTLARLLLDLIPLTGGSLYFDGIDVVNANRATKKNLRRRMNMVFQDPFSSLDPRMTVARIVGEPMVAHKTVKNRREMVERAIDLIEQCGLFPDQIYRYPHQFSGGQRQRICIARALAASPDFIICDEAVSALDVSIQAQVINLLMDLQEQHNLTYAFISHDLNVVRFISDEIIVMYLGQIVERAPKEELFEKPLHPYTIALQAAVPSLDENKDAVVLEGDIPSPTAPPPGCRFHTRCPKATSECSNPDTAPSLKEITPGHFVRCHYA